MMCGRSGALRCAWRVGCCVLLLAAVAAGGEPSDELRAPAGFRVELFADDPLAHDIFALTFDSQGRLVVSGPGYIRILLDEDRDGRADRAQTFADGPASGAQGLCFHGADLYCVADGGVLRYRDQDGDDRADAPPELVFTIRTGGEHHAHALRRGPDGWWYLLVGNDAGVSEEHAAGASLVRKPRAGALLRLAPDFSSSEVYSDGYRNAYDFDFHAWGDIFVWDSDGERDVSLPWYQPTRVMMALPGSSAGWVSRSWKRPDYYCDMPPVLARLGRGSPTGVVMYRHSQFPEPYRDALFVADWTFGRVLALPLSLEHETATWTTEPLELLRGVGQFGFAPTDLDVSPEGDLYVSVGGRGTRGGVYRLRWMGDAAVEPSREPSLEPSDTPPVSVEVAPRESGDALTAALSTPQPLSSWARRAWRGEAGEVERLRTAVLSSHLSLQQRIRAVEILTEFHGGLDHTTHTALQTASAPGPLRAKAAWSLGRSPGGLLAARQLALYLRDSEPLVIRQALESLLTVAARTPWLVNSDTYLPLVSHPAPAIRALVAGLPRESPATDYTPNGNQGVAAELTRLRARLGRPEAEDLESLRHALALWPQAGESQARRLELLRVMQLALGDMGPGHSAAAVYDGYASQLGESSESARALATPHLESWFPTDNVVLDAEIARVASILAIHSPPFFDALLNKLTEDSSPVDDLHYLIAASRIGVELDELRSQSVARALLKLELKMDRYQLRQDRNWEPRVGELYAAWIKRDARLPAVIVSLPSFGHPGHILFVADMNQADRRRAAARFAERLGASTETEITGPVARLLLESEDPELEAFVRRSAAAFDETRHELIRYVAQRGSAEDRSLIVEGLESWQPELVSTCLSALQQLPPATDAEELSKLFSLVRMWGRDAGGEAIGDAAARLLERASGADFGFPYGRRDEAAQRAVNRALAGWQTWLHQSQAISEDALRPAGASQLPNLDAVPWDAGQVERGRQWFQRKACAQCHHGRTALGPDLAGVTARFSREDLFRAIVEPDRDVSPRYATTVVETRDGRLFQGAVIYDSVDGLTLLTGSQETVRLEASDVASRRMSPRSLMPTGLLAGAGPSDLADLYAYLRTLGVQ